MRPPGTGAPEGGAAAPPPPAAAFACPACAAAAEPTDHYCEECGANLTSAGGGDAGTSPAAGRPAAACRCGSAEFTSGYCDDCGRRQPAARDHAELDRGLLAGVSDRGRRHRRNEDALALGWDLAPDGTPAAVAVVCDGVSTVNRPDEASAAVARAAVAVLLAAVRAGTDPGAATRTAVARGVDAVTELAGPDDDASPPSCTYVSAVVTPTTVTVGWVGDSRAYWLAAADGPQTRSVRLTVDDTLAARWAEAWPAADGQPATPPDSDWAHALASWIGPDRRDITPQVVTLAPGGPGVVLLCSDGLWNYLEQADALAGAALPGALTDPLAAARGLVQVALDGGGHDNVTAAVVPFPPARPAAAPSIPTPVPAARTGDGAGAGADDQEGLSA